jgi:hypothetical protein
MTASEPETYCSIEKVRTAFYPGSAFMLRLGKGEIFRPPEHLHLFPPVTISFRCPSCGTMGESERWAMTCQRCWRPMIPGAALRLEGKHQ